MAAPSAKKCDRVNVFVSEKFGGWQEVCLGILSEKYDAANKKFPAVNEILDAVKSSSLAQQADFKNVMKMVMPFIKFKIDETIAVGPSALSLRLIFDEIAILNENKAFITRVCGIKELNMFAA